MHAKPVLWEIVKIHIFCMCVTKLLDQSSYSNSEITDHDIVQWHFFPRKETKVKSGKVWGKKLNRRGIQVHHDVSPKLDILTDFVDVHAEPQQNAQAYITWWTDWPSVLASADKTYESNFIYNIKELSQIFK